jgi:syntaxin 8
VRYYLARFTTVLPFLDRNIVDRHEAQFRRARGRLDRFSRKARENWSLTVIIVLIVVLVLLIVITK